FEELLKKEGLKVTAQRLLVAEKVFSLHSHFTAESLSDMFKDKRDEISKATIYRILSIMVKGNLLVENDFGKDYKYYEHIIGHEHHDHIICMDCNRIVEFFEPKIEELQDKIAHANDFTIKGHSLNIYANCKKGTSCEYLNSSPK
ncbi:MAG: transcriptional repressor, partial [Spirochaetia bacterium]|nr:transcriptional repressor [Spirochaetia bacterium]